MTVHLPGPYPPGSLESFAGCSGTGSSQVTSTFQGVPGPSPPTRVYSPPRPLTSVTVRRLHLFRWSTLPIQPEVVSTVGAKKSRQRANPVSTKFSSSRSLRLRRRPRRPNYPRHAHRLQCVAFACKACGAIPSWSIQFHLCHTMTAMLVVDSASPINHCVVVFGVAELSTFGRRSTLGVEHPGEGPCPKLDPCTIRLIVGSATRADLSGSVRQANAAHNKHWHWLSSFVSAVASLLFSSRQAICS